MESYRVFISYSHSDAELVGKIVGILERVNLKPMWDKNFAYGYGFHEQIQHFIAHAHVFLPVITSDSSKRGWVHQEIGYATALNIPVLPLVIDAMPGEMIQMLQAVVINRDLSNAEALLKREAFDNLVSNYSDPSFGLFQCADLAEERAVMMAKYANNVERLGEYDCVRQRGGLSSFHIPDRSLNDPVWKDRYDGEKKSDYHCKCQMNERQALEKHARRKGCRLIINPSILETHFGPRAQKARIRTLVDFMESIQDGMIQVAVNNEMGMQESITMVGDWFAAESVSRSIRGGYRQTNFTRHAPSMKNRVEQFDRELADLLERSGWTPDNSRSKALETLYGLLGKLEQIK